MAMEKRGVIAPGWTNPEDEDAQKRADDASERGLAPLEEDAVKRLADKAADDSDD